MSLNAYLVFKTAGDPKIEGESTSVVPGKTDKDPAIEISDWGFGVSMPVTSSRSDGGGATVGRANFDVFTASKAVDTSTISLVTYCCKGTAIPKIIVHLFRAGEGSEASGVVKYAMVVFQFCVITKVAITCSGEELPKESLEFNYGACEYQYRATDHETGAPGAVTRFAWSTVKNMVIPAAESDFTIFKPS